MAKSANSVGEKLQAGAIKQKLQAMFSIANANYPSLELKDAEPPVNNSYFHSPASVSLGSVLDKN